MTFSIEFQYPSKRVILPDVWLMARWCLEHQDRFQYPSKRVILPDVWVYRLEGYRPEGFQYPSKRVILPDVAMIRLALAREIKYCFNTPVSG